MKLKTLFLGISIEKESIDQTMNPFEASSLFDYDIVIFDPDCVLFKYKETLSSSDFLRAKSSAYGETQTINNKLKEESRLLLEKGGVLVCLLRPLRGFSFEYSSDRGVKIGYETNYDWFPFYSFDHYTVKCGKGKRIHISDKLHAFDQYLKMDKIYWTAYIDDVDRLKYLLEEGSRGQSVILECMANNDAGKCIALEIKYGLGSIIFIPLLDDKKASHIILDCAIRFLSQKRIHMRPEPEWLDNYQVPFEDEVNKRIKDLQGKLSEIEESLQNEESERISLIEIKKLLFEGDNILENVVKEAFLELGFELDKKGHMDWITSPSDQKRAILEVTGSEGNIDIEKLRQLLDYLISDYEKTKEMKKAILVGNPFMNDHPNCRGVPFTQMVVDQSKIYDICLLTTVELFKMICSIREDRTTKDEACQQLLNTKGLFEFKF